jgi:uncharacterized protein YeeX (DUF496 family)
MSKLRTPEERERDFITSQQFYEKADRAEAVDRLRADFAALDAEIADLRGVVEAAQENYRTMFDAVKVKDAEIARLKGEQ